MLTKITHPTLVAKEIIIRTNKDEDTTDLERYIGKSYPLIRILDRTVEQGSIKSFVYKIGENLLPEIQLMIEDSEVRLREVLKSNIDTITVYMSNNIDGSFSKQEYIISNMFGSTEEATLSLIAVLYVPKFFERNMRVFKGTSIETLTELCNEVGLGLSSNFNPNDQMTRIQDNSTNLDFIRNTVGTADCTAVHCFIDQWSYLNFVDVEKALKGNDQIEFTVNPYSGVALSAPQNLVLSNNTLDTERVGKIAVWSPNDDYGIKSLSYVSSYGLERFDLVGLDKDQGSELKAFAQEIRAPKRKLVPQSDNVWNGYFISKYYGGYTLDTINQSTELVLRMQYPIHSLYPSLNLPVEIYNVQKRGEYYENTDQTLTLDKMPQNTDEGSRKLVKNELYSGSYYLNMVEMRYFEDQIEQRLFMRQV